MSVIKEAEAESADKIQDNKSRLSEIAEKVSLTVKAPVYAYFDDVRINENGFYNESNAGGDISIANAAENLKDEELFPLILSEVFVSSGKVSGTQKFEALVYVFLHWLLAAFAMSTVVFFLMSRSAVGDFSVIYGLFNGNLLLLATMAVIILCCLAFAAIDYKARLNKVPYWEADKRTVKETGNKQALVNALNCMKAAEPDKKRKRIFDKRIKKASKIKVK